MSHWNEPAHDTYALIAFMPNLGTQRTSAAFAGTGCCRNPGGLRSVIPPSGDRANPEAGNTPGWLSPFLRNTAALDKHRFQFDGDPGGREQNLLRYCVKLSLLQKHCNRRAYLRLPHNL